MSFCNKIVCREENDSIVHFIFSLREMERIESKKLNNIQESIKVIKADSLILLYTYFSKKGYFSKHSVSVLDANKLALFSF